MLEPSGDPRKDVELMATRLTPLLDGFWAARGREWYGAEHWSVQPVPLAQLWMDRTAVLVSAEDGGRPVGFLMGIHLSPFFTASMAFQVEAYWGETGEADRALVDFVRTAFQFYNARQLVLPRYGDGPALADHQWRASERRSDVYGR
jgi:hypothetical protein